MENAKIENSDVKAAFALFVVLLSLLLCHAAEAKLVYVAEVEGDIDAGSYQYISRVIDLAEEDGADLIVLKINTRGGLLKATRAVVDRIIESRVKVAGYVSKKFSGAYSSGAYVLMASNISAVNPQGFVGLAQPKPVDNRTVLPMAGYMAQLAEVNHRDAATASSFVLTNSVLDGKSALDKRVAEYAPENLQQLLAELDLSGSGVEQISPSPEESCLSLMSNPQLISFFFLIGCLAAIYLASLSIFYFTGRIDAAYARRIRYLPLLMLLPISFLVVLWGLQNMYFSPLGMVLMALGIALVSVEMATTRSTMFGFAGGLSIVVGMIIIDSEPFLASSMEITVLAMAASVIALIIYVMAANRMAKATVEKDSAETEALIGEKGRVVEELRPNGLIKVRGKLRQAYSVGEEKIEMGATVQVVKIEGRVLNVMREGGPKKPSHGYGSHDVHDVGNSSGHDTGHGTNMPAQSTRHDHRSHAPSGHDDQSHHFTGGPDPNFHEHDHEEV